MPISRDKHRRLNDRDVAPSLDSHKGALTTHDYFLSLLCLNTDL